MIESVNGFKYPASSYTIWLMSTVWRRKTSILVIFVLTALLVICMQYNVTKEIVALSLSRQVADMEDAGERISNKAMPFKNRVHSGHFLGGVDNDDSLASRDNNLVDVIGRSGENDFNRRAAGDFGIAADVSLKRNVEMPYIPGYRIVHLDLKGAPPKLAYLRKIFPMLKDLGATSILLEWEDMFPWENNLKHLAAHNAYSRKDAKEIINLANKYKLEVIPAIQTFGHMEFALKNVDFVHLREVPESPQALCPSLNASLDFVREMIDQVMKLHGNTNFLHIGCDEVLHLGECSRCRKRLRDELFLAHVSTIARYVRDRYNAVPIVWDDMLRHVPSSSLEEFKMGELVEPMVWVYAEDIYRFVPQTVWEKYQSVFGQVWTASAFKGAFGETFYVPNVKRHLENNMNWLALMSVEEPRFRNGFRGIAITGWQRYDHFATLCELLPASLPSLVVSLTAVSHGYANNSLREKLYTALNCGVVSGVGPYVRGGSDVELRASFLDLDNDPFLWDQFSRCMFPGSQFYRMLYRWRALEREVNEFLATTKTKRAWLTDYNIRRNYSVPFRVDELMADESRMYHNMLSMVQSIQESLNDIFDKYTIAEWIEQKLYPTVIQLEELQKASQRLKSMQTWPRRPLPPLTDLLRIGVTVLTNTSGSSNTA